MLEIYDYNDAPGFAQHASSFKTDERCYGVDSIVGDTYDEVLGVTLHFYDQGGYIDYDVVYSAEGDKYVGTTVKDH